MTLSSVIGNFRTSASYTVTREVAETYSSGVLVEGATSTISIDASIQPVMGKDLQVLPEGQHVKDVKVIFTTTQLFTRTSAYAPDVVTIDGEDYRVFKVEGPWIIGNSTHYKAFASKIDPK